jgi:hypothetical protein
MMVSNSGTMPHRTNMTHIDQIEENSDSATDPSTVHIPAEMEPVLATGRSAVRPVVTGRPVTNHI